MIATVLSDRNKIKMNGVHVMFCLTAHILCYMVLFSGTGSLADYGLATLASFVRDWCSGDLHMDAKNAIDYRAVLADLIARREALNAAIDAISQIQNMAEAGQGSETAALVHNNGITTVRSDAFFGMSIGDAARKYLSLMKQPRAASDIANALDAGGLTHSSKNLAATLLTTLTRRERAVGDVVRVNRKWGLKEWYPGFKPRKQDDLDKPDEQEVPTEK